MRTGHPLSSLPVRAQTPELGAPAAQLEGRRLMAAEEQLGTDSIRIDMDRTHHPQPHLARLVREEVDDPWRVLILARTEGAVEEQPSEQKPEVVAAES